ncbi:hypothetical protein [Mycobacterium phage WXIN]|nr:hypothetical protein [Mycobacterium phage WXIN]
MPAMYDAYSDAELIRMARKAPRDEDIRAELWDRADSDAEYRGDETLAGTLEVDNIPRRPVGESHARHTSLTDRYRKRFT